jgi:thioesterase domain-containing protein/acyl carrier protein
VVNILSALDRYYPFRESDGYLLKTNYIFDVSVTELFGWFLGGGRLVILPVNAEKDPHQIIDIIETSNITHVNFVPSMFNAFTEVLKQDKNSIDAIAKLKYVFLAGEALTPETVIKFNELGTGIQLENIYGPTEATIYGSRYPLSHWTGGRVVPIGEPVQNTKLYILDSFNNLVPPGVVGELCISGAGLARGYLNRPELTNEKFLGVQGPFFKKVPGRRRLYKTGDLGRWLPDGNIEYLGRMDHQVKIRGFRLELGEIENRLPEHPGVKEAVVISRESETGDKYLCAYFTTQPGEGAPAVTNGEDLREFLSRKLPHYMIPSYFVPIEKIPLTPNGKVNRKALPVQEMNGGRTYTPPSNETEEQLAVIWREMLGWGNDLFPGAPGIDDDFFLLGGHSIKITVMALRIEKAFNVKIPVLEIYKRPTIRRLAVYIGEKRNETGLPRDEKLVLLRKAPERSGGMETSHLFFIHDGTGEVDGYVEFCRHLRFDPPMNCWGIRLQTGQLQNHEQGGPDIQDLARQYIAAVKSLQPCGPYHISGWSLGGVIVFEMARQLEKNGETPGFIALIDSPAPNTYLSRMALENFSDEEIDQRTGRMGNVDIIRTLHQARASYVPPAKIKTPVHYFESSQSKEIDKMIKRKNLKQWKKLTGGKITCYGIPGDHHSILAKPQAAGFAEIFGKALKSSV